MTGNRQNSKESWFKAPKTRVEMRRDSQVWCERKERADGHKSVTQEGSSVFVQQTTACLQAATPTHPGDQRAGRPSNPTSGRSVSAGDGAGGLARGGHVMVLPAAALLCDPGQVHGYSLPSCDSEPLAREPPAAAVPACEGHSQPDGRPPHTSVMHCQCQRQGSQPGDRPQKGPPSTLGRDHPLEGPALGRTILWKRPPGRHIAVTGGFSSHDTEIICTPGSAYYSRTKSTDHRKRH